MVSGPAQNVDGSPPSRAREPTTAFGATSASTRKERYTPGSIGTGDDTQLRQRRDEVAQRSIFLSADSSDHSFKDNELGISPCETRMWPVEILALRKIANSLIEGIRSVLICQLVGKVSRLRHMVPGGSRESLPKRKVRFADHPEVALNSVCDHPAAAGIYPQSALALGTFA
jgi:hypothetical protein